MRKEEYFQKGLDIWEAAGKRYIPEEAADEFRRAADLGHIKSMYYLGVYCEMQANDYVNPHPRAEYWLKKAAEAGDADAQFQLGYYYERDPRRLFIQEGGDALNLLQLNPDDCPDHIVCRGELENYRYKAVKWYRKAAEQGHVRAQFYLGLICERGIGSERLERDREEAEKWIKKAAEHGYGPAMCWMGYYCMGNAVTMPKDERKALGWYLRAAEAGSEEACFRLGLIYEHGLGVEPDQEKALEWYRRGRIPWWAVDVKKKLEAGNEI